MRFSAGMMARARASLARIERDAGPWDGAAAEAANADRQATMNLLRRYGRSRTGLMGARPPQWRPSDGFKPNGWKRTSWEDRLNFCLDVELALFGLRSPRQRHVLMQSFALDRNRVDVARELGICTRTLSRIENAALGRPTREVQGIGCASVTRPPLNENASAWRPVVGRHCGRQRLCCCCCWLLPGVACWPRAPPTSKASGALGQQRWGMGSARLLAQRGNMGGEDRVAGVVLGAGAEGAKQARRDGVLAPCPREAPQPAPCRCPVHPGVGGEPLPPMLAGAWELTASRFDGEEPGPKWAGQTAPIDYFSVGNSAGVSVRFS